MVDGLKSFFRELLDQNPIKEKHVNLTVEQLEDLTKQFFRKLSEKMVVNPNGGFDARA